MRTWSHIYTGMDSFREFLTQNEIPDSRPLLIRIHTAVHGMQSMKQLLDALYCRLPMAKIVGCSSPSIIYMGRQLNNVCLISVTDPDDFDIDSCCVPCFKNTVPVSGYMLAEQLCKELDLYQKQGQLLVFLPQHYFQCSRFAARISELAPGIRMIGGVANDVQAQIMEGKEINCSDFTFTQQQCGTGIMAAASITGEGIFCHEGHALGKEPLIENVPVTEHEGNLIHSIDGMQPIQWLSNLTDGRLGLADNSTLRILPLVRNSCPQCGWPMAFIQEGEHAGSIIITDHIEDDETFSMSYLSTNRVVEDVLHMYRDLKSHPMEFAFVYSCTLRAEILQNCASWELGPVQTIDASGAFLGGEFYHDGTRNYFGNCNVVISALAGSEVYVHLNTQSLHDTHRLYHDNEHLVDFLVACADCMPNGSGNFEQMIRSHLYTNESMELGTMTKLYYDIQSQGIDKLCMLSIRNGSELVAYAGYKAYYGMVKDIIKKIRRHLADELIWFYMTEQGDVLLCSNASIAADRFEQMMRELYENVLSLEFSRMMPILEFSIVLEEKNLIRCAKVVQSVLRSRKELRFLIYSPDMGMEESSIRDVQMVQIIHDAIANNRVQPFYQGIYDNDKQKITMYESLMRLRDVDGKLYFPNDFLPIARKYGLYRELSRQMICRVMETFEQQDALVTMNLSTQDILDPEITNAIYQRLQNSSHPERFVFEIVECEDISDYEPLCQFAERIHTYGCKLALDDFGSGFSNLIHVIHLDLDYLKVDGAIIQKICEDADCRQLLEIVAMWCRMHGKKVIAEYVENDHIQDILCGYSVDYSQGYLFSRPGLLTMTTEEDI